MSGYVVVVFFFECYAKLLFFIKNATFWLYK